MDFKELVRCIRDCFGMETEEDYACDCDNCLMKDKIVEHTYEDGEPYFADYTECESALGLAAADAIEYLMRKLEAREAALASLAGCLGDSTTATADVLDTTEDLIT